MKYRPGEGAIPRARALRRDRTDAEQAMWRLLRDSFPEARFRFQVPMRRYTADFASHRARLIIEVDGGHHADIDESKRTTAIEAEGYRILRFWNNDVLENPDGVWHVIAEALAESTPTLTLPHQGGGD
ncbi:MAG: endonuclease domain-containing protein [Sphingosinicella sp.]